MLADSMSQRARQRELAGSIVTNCRCKGSGGSRTSSLGGSGVAMILGRGPQNRNN